VTAIKRHRKWQWRLTEQKGGFSKSIAGRRGASRTGPEGSRQLGITKIVTGLNVQQKKEGQSERKFRLASTLPRKTDQGPELANTRNGSKGKQTKIQSHLS